MPFALYILNGPRKGETFPLKEGKPVTLGRSSANLLRFMDRKLSRIHCQFQVIGGRCQLSDLNSTNGTSVNGERARQDVWLAPEDEVEAGQTLLRLIEISPAEAEWAESQQPAPAASEAEESSDEVIAARAPKEERPPQAEESSAEAIPAGQHERVCAECGRVIPPEELLRSAARSVGDRFYCGKCAASFNEGATVEESEIEASEAPEYALGKPLEPGAEIAGVRILASLGEGRLGRLYKGEQISMGRLVTLKVLSVRDADWSQKYLHAVYTSGQLVHQNIPLIFDTGEEDGAFYLIREHVEGQSLEARLSRRHPVPPFEAFNLITQIAHAVEFALERRVVHGSLSPRKILIAEHDVVKVTGFGLPQWPPHDMNETLYRWYALPYMAPERLRGQATVDFTSDVYSLAALFYHMLTGRAPFRGPSHEEIEHRIQTRLPKPLADVVPGLPDTAQQIINRGLSKDPRQRYQSPRELLFDLEDRLRREL